mgnify:CR=1 FL=1
MEMFQDGGLMDEGGTVDPVSGNDVPPGSTQEEVRDDIPAQLSEGEFVFPADVVRFIGLEKLMKEEDLIKTVASAIPVFFSKQNFTVSLDNEQYLVETRLSVESTPSSKSNTIPAKVDGHSFSFNVKVEK